MVSVGMGDHFVRILTTLEYSQTPTSTQTHHSPWESKKSQHKLARKRQTA